MSLKSFSIRAGKTVVYFGIGAVKNVEGFVRRFRRAYVVTSRSAARVSGALTDVEAILKSAGVVYEVFDRVSPNPSAKLVNELGERVWRFGAELVIAIGGGSVIDSAKLAAVLAQCGGYVEDYINRRRDVCGALPIIAVNLTHGTGSEVDKYAVATLEDPRVKIGIGSEHMYLAIAVEDPQYLRTLPRNQTMYTAFDAFYHAVESATTILSSPYVVALAEEAVRNIVKWLPVAINDPSNIEARYWLLYASMVAGIAIDNTRTHMVHALEHVISGLNEGLAHGAGLAMLGPVAIKHVYKANPETLHRLLRYLDPSLEPTPSHAEKASEAVKRFHIGVGFRENLRMYGFSEQDADKVVELAQKYLQVNLSLSPIEPSKDILKEMYLSALNFV